MAKKQTRKESKRVRAYLGLAFAAAVFVGIIVYGGVRSTEATLVWAGITFIVALVGIATLDLAVKDDDSDPNKPRLK
jgi:high-affinity Fe2+/Pb2+ permease